MSDAGSVSGPVYIHATAVVIREQGVLLRGPSGSGKTSLARALLWEAARDRLFAQLVGDDRISLEARNLRLIARGHPATAGLIERRMQGIVAMPYEAACVLALVVDLAGATMPVARYPEPEDGSVELHGIALPRLHIKAIPDVAPARVILEILSHAC